MNSRITNSSSSKDPEYQRGAVNTIYPRKLYQRGQVMTWSLERKQVLFAEYNIGIVVNFWSKIDADMSECHGITYIYRPTPHSVNMLDRDIPILAGYIADFISVNKQAGLILCEAGKTRSVFFAALVLASLKGLTTKQALEEINLKVPGHRMKPNMIEYLQKGDTGL